jgi:hypothetical protein
MGYDEGVVVHVNDLGLRADGLSHFVGSAGSGQTRPDVQELAYSALTSQVAHYAGEKRAICPRAGHHPRTAGSDLLGRLAIGGIVIFRPQPVRVDTSRVRHIRIESAQPPIDGLAISKVRLRGGIAERCTQLARVGADDRVRVLARVLAAGDVADSAASVLAPDPELREILAQGSNLVM